MLNNYALLKTGGYKSVQKMGAGAVLTSRNFDPHTGEELNPSVVPIDKANVEKQIEILKKGIDLSNSRINDLQSLLDDVAALDVPLNSQNSIAVQDKSAGDEGAAQE